MSSRRLPAGVRDRRPVTVAAALTVAAVTMDLVAVAGSRTAGQPIDPGRLSGLLIAVGLLCVIGLTASRAESIAWLAAVLASGLATIEILGGARGGAAYGDMGLPVSEAARAGMAGIAAGFVASRDARRGTARALRSVGVALVGLVAVAEVAVAVAGQGASTVVDTDAARLANRVLLGYVALAAALAIGLELAPRIQDARRRIAADPSGPSAHRGLLGLVIDDLLPTARVRSEAEEAERVRLATDLHAAVLPELRTALAAAPTPEVRDRVAAAVGELEQVMAARQPVIVDALGLLAGLEWLAERMQERFGLVIELEVEDADAAGRAPLAVERAGFRVAQLALDNVGRHSGATEATLLVSIGPDHVLIRIVDHGRGRHPTAVGGRGLGDMRVAAATVDATIEIDDSSGTTVVFRWAGRPVR